MDSRDQWYGETAKDWGDFTTLLDAITVGHTGEKHHFLCRGQVDSQWRLVPSLVRDNKHGNTEKQSGVERDAKHEFSAQAHQYLAVSDLPGTEDWLGWWALMQHYRAPTRLLDWTASPYVAAYFAVESGDETDGAIWVVNDWALGDRMRESYPNTYRFFGHSPRPTSDWSTIAKSFTTEVLFSANASPQVFFLQPARRSIRVIAQQGWFCTSPRLDTDYCAVIADLFEKHRQEYSSDRNTEYRKYWNCRITIPYRAKPEFMRRLQTMNITAASLFPGVDGLGRSIREFIRVESMHDKPGSSHPLP